jgi:glycosyltransferase 2 family protein
MLKTYGFFALKVMVSAGLIWLLVERIEIGAVAERLTRLAPGAIAASLAILLVQSVLASWRWWIVSHRVGVPLGFSAALRLLFVGLFFNQTLVSSIGGDAVRIWFVRHLASSMAGAFRSVLIDRLVALVSLILIVAASLPVLLDLVATPAARAGVLAVLGVGIGVLVLLLLLDRLPVLPQRLRTKGALDEFAAACRGVVLNGRTGIPVLGLSLVIHLLSALTVFVLARGIGIEVSFGHIMVLVPPVILVATLPISVAGWGVREGAMVTALGYVGVTSADAFAVSVILGLALIVVALPGGALWLIGLRRRTRPAPPPPATSQP